MCLAFSLHLLNVQRACLGRCIAACCHLIHVSGFMASVKGIAFDDEDSENWGFLDFSFTAHPHFKLEPFLGLIIYFFWGLESIVMNGSG